MIDYDSQGTLTLTVAFLGVYFFLSMLTWFTHWLASFHRGILSFLLFLRVE